MKRFAFQNLDFANAQLRIMKMKIKKWQIFFSFLIFGFSFLIFNSCQAAVLYLMPQTQTVYQGDSFLVEVRLDSGEQEINTAQIDLELPELLEVVDFSKGKSMFSLWPQEPAIKNSKISFVGGTPQGFIGDDTVLIITFKGKQTGKGVIDFSKECKVLLNDGKGTEAELVFLEGSYEIIERPKKLIKISSPSHPDQDKWYSNNSPHIRWDFIEENEYSYLLSHDPLAEPDEIPDRPEGELMWLGDMGYSNMEDGIYYFHLREKYKDTKEWELKVSFRMMIDTKAPEEFTPKIGQDSSVFEGKYFLSFYTTDKMSGTDHYEISEIKDKQQDKDNWKVVKSPYVLEDQTLNSIIKVKAVDKAGNERIAEIIPPEKPAPIFPYWKVTVSLLLIGVIYWVWKKYTSSRKK